MQANWFPKVFDLSLASYTQTLTHLLAIDTARRKNKVKRCPPGALGDYSKPGARIGF
jgi:hypothetical protein